MKSHLVDVPVQLNVFVRPNTLKKVFDVVKKARPSILFLVSDGPRADYPTDKGLIKMSREIVEEIDWECNVFKLYTDDNKGMYATGKAAKEFIFERVDRCIFLEDDVLVSVSFFRYCLELLEKYKDDLRIHYITGMNYLDDYKEPNADYFFANEGSIWGFATWRRTIEQEQLDYRGNEYVIKKLREITKNERKEIFERIQGYAKSDIYEGHIPGCEFYKELCKFSQNQTFIVPSKNMVSNIGITEGSVHAPNELKKLPKGVQQLFYMKTHEYEFPLRHSKHVIRDLEYEKKVKRIMAWGHPIVSFYRDLERAIRYVYFGDTERLLKKMKIRIFLKNTLEK